MMGPSEETPAVESTCCSPGRFAFVSLAAGDTPPGPGADDPDEDEKEQSE